MLFARPSPLFDWIRFWLPRTEPLDLNGGFLPDPEGEFDRFRNLALRTLDSLGESPVLVLLGRSRHGGAGHGLYLVAWYACEFWQGQDDKRRRCERAAYEQDDLQAKLSALADSHSDQEFRLRAFVLDVRHPA